MIHIATVHWAYDHWIDVQLAYFDRNIDEPYRVYAWLDDAMMDHASKFFYATDVQMKEHERKLTLLGDLMAHAAEPDDMLVFIDGDAFPIAPMVPFLREKLDEYPLVAVRRDDGPEPAKERFARRPRSSGWSSPATGAAATSGRTARARGSPMSAGTCSAS